MPFVYNVFMEQVFSPLWQGVLWGLGGVLFTSARQLMAINRARHMGSNTSRAVTVANAAEKTAPVRQRFSAWIAGLGLSRLFV